MFNKKLALVGCGAVLVAAVLCLALGITVLLIWPSDSRTSTSQDTRTPTATRAPSAAVENPNPSATAAPSTPVAAATKAPIATPIPTATPTSKPILAGASRSNPLPLGSEFKGKDWSITIGSVQRGAAANQAVAKANMFNKPPRSGFEYLIANLTVKNISDKPEAQSASFGVHLRITGDKNTVYSAASVVAPKELQTDLFPKGVAEGQIVFEVPSAEKNLMFLLGETLSFDSNAIRFIAVDNGAKIVPDAALLGLRPTDLGKRRDSPAQLGETLIAGSWQFQVIEAVRGDKAAALVKAANMFNKPAPAGQEYVAIRLKARYLGNGTPDQSANIDGSFLKITGEKNVVYESPSVVDPEPQFDATLFAGGETEGWCVLSVAKDEKGLSIIVRPLFSFSPDDTRYVALQ